MFTEYIKNLYNVDNFFFHEGGKADYSFNQVNGLSKILNKGGEEILNEILVELNKNHTLNSKIDKNSILVNLKDEFLLKEINNMLIKTVETEELFGKPEKKKEKIIIDFSSPNLCKEMHVGHLRSTIIGESLCRIFEYLGDNVVRLNHVGDHGLQFGMILAYIKSHNITEFDLKKLTPLYKEAKKLFDSDMEFKDQSRLETFNLQNGNEENVLIWKKLYDISLKGFNDIYQILGTHAIVRGESFYQEHMKNLILELEEKCKIINHENMKVIFSNGKHLILVKKDGAFTYDTSDLAALRFRLIEENADKVLYVVDIGQEEHFSTLFSVANDLGYISEDKKTEYIGFGVVLGEDGKRLKTRSGETVKLLDLLNDGYISSLELTKKMAKDHWDEETISNIARKISINCIKYTDLSNPRLNSYKFSTSKMLNTKGNTAVYLMYAMARCKSILKKVDLSNIEYKIVIENKESRDLIFLLLKYPEIILKASKLYSPHYLCNYLYSLISQLTKYYENNRCIEFIPNTKEILSINETRISLIFLSIKILELFFFLIGLENIEQI